MKNIRHEFPDSPENRISEAVNMRNDSRAAAGPRQRKAKWCVTEDATQVNVEKDLYVLLADCLKMLELEKKRKDLPGKPELGELDAQMTAMMENMEIFVTKIVSGARQRLGYTEKARP